MRNRSDILPAVVVAAASAAWGLYWIPQRALEDAGLTGGWATLAQFAVPIVLLAPAALWRGVRSRATGLELVSIGLLFGGAFACYANSFLLTDVVRALLLFYVAPVWITLIELVVLRRRVTLLRALTLALGIGGIWLVFAAGTGWPVPRNAGDWLAFAGGVAFAAAAVRINVLRPAGVFPLLFAFFLYGGLIGIVLAVLLRDHLGPTPALASMAGVLPWLLALAILFIIPSMAGILWGPTRLDPGIYGLLVLTDIVFGVVSAALFAGEPFGWREVAGSVLIVSAGVVEVALGANRTQAPA